MGDDKSRYNKNKEKINPNVLIINIPILQLYFLLKVKPAEKNNIFINNVLDNIKRPEPKDMPSLIIVKKVKGKKYMFTKMIKIAIVQFISFTYFLFSIFNY